MTIQSIAKATLSLTFFLVIHAAFAGSPQMPPVPVESQKVSLTTLIEEYPTIANLQATSSVVITPEVAGKIVSIPNPTANQVEKGALLFKLDDSLLQAELKQATSKRDFNRSQYERHESLASKQSTSLSQKEESQSDLKSCEASVSMIQARINQTELRAPFAGQVGLSAVEVGDYVTPGTALMTLVATQQLRVDFRIPETLMSKIAVGKKFTVQVEGLKGQTFEGVVTAIEPHSDPITHSITLRGTLDNRQLKLKPGLLADIRFQLSVKPHAIVVPETTIQLSPQGAYLYKIVEGKAKRTQVTIGTRQKNVVEVLTGLTPEDTYIISGQNRLHDGAAVSPVKSKP